MRQFTETAGNMLNIRLISHHRLGTILAGTLLAGWLLAAPAGASIKAGANYVGGNLTMEVKNATMGELLEAIARTAGVDVYIASGFQSAGERMTLQIVAEPLEDVLRRILRGYNYAAIYEKEGNDFRIATLKIYPEGMQGREVIPLFKGRLGQTYEEKTRRGGTVTVLVNAVGQIVTRGTLTARRGALGPSETELTGAAASGADLHSPWLALQLQLEQDETDRFAELLLLRKQVEATADTQRQQALSMVYADAMAKFQLFKKGNLNKVESLKRINQFQDVTGK